MLMERDLNVIYQGYHAGWPDLAIFTHWATLESSLGFLKKYSAISGYCLTQALVLRFNLKRNFKTQFPTGIIFCFKWGLM